jgi:iron(III) transport system substrate-binding protein
MKLHYLRMTLAVIAALCIPAAYAQTAAAVGAGAAPAKPMTPYEQTLYAAAKKEGSVVWYTSQSGTKISEDVCKLFTARYPGVACNSVRATAQVVFQRLIQETRAKATHADVLSTNNVTDLLTLKKEGSLQPYKPENLRYMVPRIQATGNKDGYWIPTQLAPLGIVYNTNLVKPADAPKTWLDMLDPKWQNQTAIAHPGFSGSVGIWVTAMRKLYGPTYFERLAKNKPQIGRSVLDGMNLVMSGERKVALAPLNTAAEEARKGAPIVVVYPTDGVLLPLSASAILKDAPHPNAAKLFMEFNLGPEISIYLGSQLRESLRSDIPSPASLPSLAKIKILNVPDEEIMKNSAEMTEYFRDVFGI